MEGFTTGLCHLTVELRATGQPGRKDHTEHAKPGAKDRTRQSDDSNEEFTLHEQSLGARRGGCDPARRADQ